MNGKLNFCLTLPLPRLPGSRGPLKYSIIMLGVNLGPKQCDKLYQICIAEPK